MGEHKKRRRVVKKSPHDYARTADAVGASGPAASSFMQPDRVVPLDDESDDTDGAAMSGGHFTEEFWREQMPPHYAQRR